MNIKELAKQLFEFNDNEVARVDLIDLYRFAELVRDDERAKCAQDYLQDCCDAVDAARLEGIKVCVELLDDFAKTQMVPAKNTWRMGVMAAANAVRDKK